MWSRANSGSCVFANSVLRPDSHAAVRHVRPRKCPAVVHARGCLHCVHAMGSQHGCWKGSPHAQRQWKVKDRLKERQWEVKDRQWKVKDRQSVLPAELLHG